MELNQRTQFNKLPVTAGFSVPLFHLLPLNRYYLQLRQDALKHPSVAKIPWDGQTVSE